MLLAKGIPVAPVLDVSNLRALAAAGHRHPSRPLGGRNWDRSGVDLLVHGAVLLLAAELYLACGFTAGLNYIAEPRL